MEKMEILNISVSPTEGRTLRALFAFVWKQKGLKYLGIHLAVSTTDLYKDNCLALLNEIKQNLKGYPAHRLSWFGRINVIKMMILLKALYIFQSLPIKFPGAYFKTLRLILLKFVRNNRGNHISYKIMSRPRERGGVFLPDFGKYHKAAALQRILDWVHGSPHKKWVLLEEGVSKAVLGQIIWIPKQHRGLSGEMVTITIESFRVWDKLLKSI